MDARVERSRAVRRLAGAVLGTLMAVAFSHGLAQVVAAPAAVLGYAEGSVAVAPKGDNEWIDIKPRRALQRGDRVWTDKGSRAEVQAGSHLLRLDGQTQVSLDAVSEGATQMSLLRGSVALSVSKVGTNENIEVGTPNLAFRARQPGDYRIDVDSQTGTTRVSVMSGNAVVYGEHGEAVDLAPGQRLTFKERTLAKAPTPAFTAVDEFDHWMVARGRAPAAVPSAAPPVHPDAVARQFREREAQRQAEAMRQIEEQKKLIAEAARNKNVAKQIAKQVQQQEQQQAAAAAAAAAAVAQQQQQRQQQQAAVQAPVVKPAPQPAAQPAPQAPVAVAKAPVVVPAPVAPAPVAKAAPPAAAVAAARPHPAAPATRIVHAEPEKRIAHSKQEARRAIAQAQAAKKAAAEEQRRTAIAAKKELELKRVAAKRAEQEKKLAAARKADQDRKLAQLKRAQQQALVDQAIGEARNKHLVKLQEQARRDEEASRDQRTKREEQAARDAQARKEAEAARREEEARKEAWERRQRAIAEQEKRDHDVWIRTQPLQQLQPARPVPQGVPARRVS